MSVLLYSHSAAHGGAELALPRLARVLGAQVLVRSAHESWLTRRLRDEGVACSVLGPGVDRRPHRASALVLAALDIVKAQLLVLRAISRDRPALLISNTIQGMLHVGLPCLLLRVPVWCYVRDLGDGGNRRKVEVHAYRFLLTLGARRVIFNSRLTRKSWKLRTKSSMVVSTAVDEVWYEHPWEAASSMEAAIVGRVSPWKGQGEVVSAMNTLTELRDRKLTIIGDSEFGETIHLPAATFEVEFAGFLDRPYERLRSVSLVVHASTTPEPFGQVTAQAAAMGAPIVCASSGGHLEWLEPGVDCWSADPRDVQAYAAVIAEALTDEEESQRRGRNARMRAEQFRGDRAYSSLVNEVEDAIGSNAAKVIRRRPAVK